MTYVFHITANLKHIISLRGKDEDGSKMYKHEKMRVQGVQIHCFLLLNKQMCDIVVTAVGVKSPNTSKKHAFT